MIRDAYCRIRTIDNSIPDDVLDFMKDAAIEKLHRAPVSVLSCGTCTDFKIVGKVFVCKKCGKEQKSISA